jgi:hypothetical protein
MKAIAKRFLVTAVLLTVPLFVSGCIVSPDWWWEEHHQPRRTTFYVYVYDYYTYAPVPWAVVEVYEEGRWGWDYLGAWPVNRAGYVAAHGGYLHADGCGGCEEGHYRVLVDASGYQREWIDIELDYWHPAETLYFYLLPRYGRDAGTIGGSDTDPPEAPLDERPPDRVMIGEPKGAPKDTGD